MISLTVKKFGHVRYLVEFVNLCLKEIDELKRKKTDVCWVQIDIIYTSVYISN